MSNIMNRRRFRHEKEEEEKEPVAVTVAMHGQQHAPSLPPPHAAAPAGQPQQP